MPPATGNNAVITVKVGGNRLTTAAVGRAGRRDPDAVRRRRTAPTTPAAGIGTNTCVSDVDGDCSWIIPNTQTGGANNNRQFWVVQTGVPAGWLQNSSLITGPDGGPFGATPYRFRTGTALVNGTTYSSGGSFMLGTGNTRADRIRRDLAEHQGQSGRPDEVRSQRRPDPRRVGLGEPVRCPPSRLAATTFTNSLVGTPSQLALFTFAATRPAPGANNQNRPLTPVSTQAGADTVNAWINGVTAGGTTNWDRGLFQVQQSTAQFDIAVIITDGNPTVYGNAEGPGNYTRFREVENGIFSANAVKAESTRMLAFGVGAGISAGGANLAAISGPTLNSDYFQTANFAQVGTILRNLALGSCTGSVTVVKQVVPNTAPVGSITGAVPAGGWTFGATTTTVGRDHRTGQRRDRRRNRRAELQPDLPGWHDHGAGRRDRDPTGRAHAGARSAASTPCAPDRTPAPAIPVTNTGALGFTVASEHRLRGHLHRVQPRPEPAGEHRGQQAVGDHGHDVRRHHDLRRRHPADRPPGRPDARWHAPAVRGRNAPVSPRATRSPSPRR